MGSGSIVGFVTFKVTHLQPHDNTIGLNFQVHFSELIECLGLHLRFDMMEAVLLFAACHYLMDHL